MICSRVRRALVRCSVAALVLSSATASFADGAPDKQACQTAYEQAQYARRDKHLRAARAQSLVCAQQACGPAAEADCGEWLREIETAMPTMVFDVRDDKGANLSRVTVTMDGEKLVGSLDGSAIPVDPGPRRFRFEAAGMAPLDEAVTVREGEKSRVLAVVLRAAPVPVPTVARAPEVRAIPETPTPATSGTTTRGSMAPGLVVGSAGLAFIAASVAVGVVAKNDLDGLRATCAPRCASSALSAVELEADVSDALLGVGIAAVGAGVLVIVLRPSHAGPTIAIRGTSLVLSGTF